MAIPQTYVGALLLAIFTMICWGSWANTTKFTGPKWRFELYYYDFSLGVMLTAILAAVTLGSFGSSDITFLDNLTIVRRKQMAFAAAAGVVFNLANMLLVGAISVAGMAVAFPIGIGLALVIGVAWSYSIRPMGNPGLLFAGAGIVVVATIVASMAYRMMLKQKELEELQRFVSQQTKKKKPESQSGWKGIILSIVSGLLMGSFYPLVVFARRDDIEMGPYPIAFVFGIAVFLSTILFNFFFINLPIEGEPISMSGYLKGTGRQHLLGLVGGAIWCAGTIASFVTTAAPAEIQVGPAVSYGLGQGATLVSTLWGLFYWKEFAGAPDRARIFMGVTIALFVLGLTLISLAPLYAKL